MKKKKDKKAASNFATAAIESSEFSPKERRFAEKAVAKVVKEHKEALRILSQE